MSDFILAKIDPIEIEKRSHKRKIKKEEREKEQENKTLVPAAEPEVKKESIKINKRTIEVFGFGIMGEYLKQGRENCTRLK